MQCYRIGSTKNQGPLDTNFARESNPTSQKVKHTHSNNNTDTNQTRYSTLSPLKGTTAQEDIDTKHKMPRLGPCRTTKLRAVPYFARESNPTSQKIKHTHSNNNTDTNQTRHSTLSPLKGTTAQEDTDTRHRKTQIRAMQHKKRPVQYTNKGDPAPRNTK